VGNSANGFQGVIFSASNEVICAYKGSKGGFASKDKMNTGYDDWRVNDVQIALNQIPSQYEAAEAFVKQAEFHAAKRRVTIVGHSLGGGLAQLAGAKLGLPFVTFNAPGMAGNLGIRKQASKVTGFNMILLKDPIGNSGQHIGKTERFLALGTTGPAHKMHAVLSALKHSDKWAKRTLDQLT
jgi:predicted alpha/beta hydrolase